MSAFDELNSRGEVGPETFALFVFNLPSVARRYGFPPPGGGAWTRDVCREWVLDFFEKKGHAVGLKLLHAATDETSLGRVVRKAIANELKDEAKATPVGKIRSRMRTLLEPLDEFKDATAIYAGTAAWTLGHFDDAIYQGDWMDLLTSPDLKMIEPIQKLNTAGPTSKQNATKLVTAARIILRTAGGAVRDQDLASALVHLFELDEPEIFFIRDNEGGTQSVGEALLPEEQVEAILAADAIIFQLSADEGRALLYFEEPLAVAAAALPRIPDVSRFLADLRAKLNAMLDPMDIPRGTFNLVLDWCRKIPD